MKETKTYTNKDLEFVIQLLQNAINLLKDLLKETGSNINSSIREQIVNFALQFNGLGKYKLGGKDLSKFDTIGIDCSGFVRAILKANGINICDGSYNQVKEGKSVKLEEARPGDLFFYYKNNKKENGIGHVGMYIGNNKMIHCGSTPISIVDVNYRPIADIRNIIGD